MGIFNRKNGVEDIFGMEEEDMQAPSGTVANPGQQSPVVRQTKPQAAKSQPRSNPDAYGIEDAIKLMRQLPNVDSEILITVVNKTLESANIKVSEIIVDAENKEGNIEERNSRLSSRISQLENEISQLNAEITTLTEDLKETSKVKNLLLLTTGKSRNDNKQANAGQVSVKPQKEEAPTSTVTEAAQA